MSGKHLFRAAVRSNPQPVYKAGPAGAKLYVWQCSQTLEGDHAAQILISDDPTEEGIRWVGVPVPFNAPLPVTLGANGELWAQTPGIDGVDVHLAVSLIEGEGAQTAAEVAGMEAERPHPLFFGGNTGGT